MVRVQWGGYPVLPRFDEFSLCAWVVFWKRQGKWSIAEVLARASIIWNSRFECGTISRNLGLSDSLGFEKRSSSL